MAMWSVVERKAAGRNTHNLCLVLLTCALISAGCFRPRWERTFAACAAGGESALVRGFVTQADALSSECKSLARTPEEVWRAHILSAEVGVAQRRYGRILQELEALPPVSEPMLNARRDMAYGLAKLRTGKLDEARSILNSVLERARKYNWHELEAETLVRMNFPGMKAPARRTQLEQALAAARLTHDPALESEVTGALGFLELERENSTTAIRWFETSLQLAQRAGALGWQQKALGNMGQAQVQLGNYELASSLFMRAAELAGRLGHHDDQIRWINSIGNTESVSGAPPKSVQSYYSTALVLARQHNVGLPQTLYNLASFSLRAKDTKTAWRYHDESMRARQAENAPPTLDFFAGLLLAEELRCDEALAVFQSIVSDPKAKTADKRQALISSAVALYKVGRHKEAFAQAEAVLAGIRAERAESKDFATSQSLQSAFTRFYRIYVNMLLQAERDMDALLFAEEARSGLHPTPESLMEAAASHNAVILDYWAGERRSIMWIITAQGIRFKRLPPESEIKALLAEHERQLSGARAEPKSLTAGQQLYRLLVGEEFGNQRVIVIADDFLGRLNWETLVNESSFWLEKATVSRAFSIASLQQTQSAGSSTNLLIYGNPDLPAAKYPTLLRAEEEIRLVRVAYGSGRTSVVDHQRAQAQAFKSHHPEQYGYIHFVTHGEASLERPLDSALIFSGEPESRLTAFSVATNPIYARLVTLSACHSAGIKSYRGAGLVGMGWAFLHAGAQSVVSALWEVSDAASAKLHPSLYARLRKGQPPAEALREAKLELLHSDSNFRKPYYWGAWVLFEGRP